MNIYLITQEINDGWDTYDSAVVVAESVDDARSIHPNGVDDTVMLTPENTWYSWPGQEDVQVKEIGVIFEGMERGVVCASFNAG